MSSDVVVELSVGGSKGNAQSLLQQCASEFLNCVGAVEENQ